MQLIIHGGAWNDHGGSWREVSGKSYQEGIRRALDRGIAILERENALEAVIASIEVLEDDPLFNCGTGSSLNLDGKAQMDAAVMTSEGMFGAVAALQNVQHPIDVAREVMTRTDHLLLAGEAATKFARSCGFPPYDSTTDSQRSLWREIIGHGQANLLPHMENFRGLQRCSDTVGAIARDRSGRLAVACSTGGLAGKLPGRVGDTAILGAGLFASRWGGAAATGHGEQIMRRLLAFRAVQVMRQEPVLKAVTILLPENPRTFAGGLIGIDWRGQIGYYANTERMPLGIYDRGQIQIRSLD
ncbi:MAG: isoaspartyl peptidase/L-asparaginase [Chloroflexi bacterium]|nr:isoaspartyl peptidase/L-asparaginase [Chloroflexota bacterium]